MYQIDRWLRRRWIKWEPNIRKCSTPNIYLTYLNSIWKKWINLLTATWWPGPGWPGWRAPGAPAGTACCWSRLLLCHCSHLLALYNIFPLQLRYFSALSSTPRCGHHSTGAAKLGPPPGPGPHGRCGGTRAAASTILNIFCTFYKPKYIFYILLLYCLMTLVQVIRFVLDLWIDQRGWRIIHTNSSWILWHFIQLISYYIGDILSQYLSTTLHINMDWWKSDIRQPGWQQTTEN